MKKYIVTGLLIWLPLVVTVWVLKVVIDMADQTLLLLPEAFRTEAWLGVHIPGMGVLLSFLVVILTGVIAANIIGQRLVDVWQEILHRIPIVRSIYSSVKQVSDTLFSSGGQAFHKALLVEWPHRDMWTICFLTGEPGEDISIHLQGEHVNVYVPSTPNPTGGYFVMVPRKDIIELDMSVDTALKYVISMGVAGNNKQVKFGRSKQQEK